MLWTRYRLLVLLGVACLAAATAAGDPLAGGYAVATLLAFVGSEYVLLGVYAALNGAYPIRSVVAAATAHVAIVAGAVLATAAPASGLFPAPGSLPATGTLADVAVDWLPLALVLAPVPVGFALGASSRATDRAPYVLGAAVVAVGGPVAANTLLVATAGTAVGSNDPELATLGAAAVALVAGLPPYLAARRRKPGFRDRYPSLDELPVSRASLTVALWLLFVVSGWGPGRVASGTALDRAWGIVPPDDLLAVPFLALMAATGVVAAGLLESSDPVERGFGVAVLAYLVGTLAAVLVPLVDVAVRSPRYLGFGAVLLVTAIAAVVAVRRLPLPRRLRRLAPLRWLRR